MANIVSTCESRTRREGHLFGRIETEVLVVGAGPTGLMAALCLAERGVAVEVIDEQWRSAAHSYALALHPRSLALLEEHSLADEAISLGREVLTIGVFEGSSRRATIKPYPPGARFPFLLALPQSALEELLEDRLAERGVRVRWNHRLAAIEDGSESVSATVHRLGKSSTGYGVAHTEWTVDKAISAKAAFVVGADGHRSMVRNVVVPSFPQIGRPETFAIFECLAGPGDPVDEMRLVLDEETTSVFWPLPGMRVRGGLQIKTPWEPAGERFKSRLATERGERPSHAVDETTLRDLLAERAPWFDASLAALSWTIEARFDRRLVDSFGRDRIWLIGDAAHLTSPVAGQSMNAGLVEASELATGLADRLRGERDQSQLETFGHRHRAEWLFLLGQRGALRPGPTADPFLARNASRLTSCLPATGADLDCLVRAMGFAANKDS